MGDLIHAFGIDWKLIVAQSVNFLVVIAILSYFVYGPVMRLLKERSEKIAQGLVDAEAARTERESAAGERTVLLTEAQHEAEKIVARAQDEGKNERAALVKGAQDRAAQIVKDGELAAEEEKRRALKESEADIARAAVLAAEKILRQNV
jgi:F-type H+-transporting ATPase subunit b